MSDEFGPSFITLTDEDGNDIELEYVDALVILKSVTENGEELLSTLDDEAELEKIYDLFMEQLLADEE